MHTLQKGAIGELAVCKDLISSGYDIYKPVVDTNHVDLIVEQAYGLMKRVQIITVMKAQRSTTISVNTSKYKNSKRVDVIAIYFLPKDIIAYVPYENTHDISLALATGKNNPTKGRKWFYSYERFPEFS